MIANEFMNLIIALLDAFPEFVKFDIFVADLFEDVCDFRGQVVH